MPGDLGHDDISQQRMILAEMEVLHADFRQTVERAYILQRRMIDLIHRLQQTKRPPGPDDSAGPPPHDRRNPAS
jgi:hypothetical protein